MGMGMGMGMGVFFRVGLVLSVFLKGLFQSSFVMVAFAQDTTTSNPPSCPSSLSDRTIITVGTNGRVSPSVNTTLDLENPVSRIPPQYITSGCPYRVSIKANTEAYFAITRPVGKRVRIEWDYSSEGGLPVHALSWNGQCCQGRHPSASPPNTFYADKIHEPQKHSGDLAFPFSPTGEDFYHCNGACRTYDFREKRGSLFITVSGFYATSDVTGDITVFVEEPQTFIKPQQIDVVRSLYDTCCASRRPPDANWRWAGGESSDSDAKPYCDWLPLRTFPNGLAGNVTDCTQVPGIVCDSDGNIIELLLPEVGLKCELPTSLADLKSLRKVDMSRNQLYGTLPLAIASMPSLETVLLFENRFAGVTPCFASDSLEVLRLANNDLEGSIPECFGQSRRLNWIDLSSNKLTGVVPQRLAESKTLAMVDLGLNLLTGTLPPTLCDLGPSLLYLRLSRNDIDGTIPNCYLKSFTNLVELDLSYNRLTGILPSLSPELTKLRSLRLQHNRMRGSVVTQFDQMVEFMAQGGQGRAVILLNSNHFSGPLPSTIESVIHSPLFYVILQMGGNHFRCDDTTHTWPRFVRKVPLPPDVLGSCEKVPRLDKIKSGTKSFDVATPVEVIGEGFDQTDDLKCIFKNGDVEREVPGLFVSSTEVHCYLPNEAIGKVDGKSISAKAGAKIGVSVANYGTDYATLESANEFLSFELKCPKSSAGTECQYTRKDTCSGNGDPKDDGGCACDGGYKGGNCSKRKGVDETLALAVGLPVCVITVGACIFIAYMIQRERRGIPLFDALDDLVEPNAMRSDNFANSTPMPMEVRIAERTSQGNAIVESVER